MRGRGRGQRVHDVVLAGQAERDASPSERARQLELGDEAGVGQPRRHVRGGEVRPLVHAEGHDPARLAGQSVPEGRESIVCVDHGGVVGAERGEHLALALRDAFKAAEAFEVGRAGIDHQPDARPRDRRKMGDLAEVVGAHLDHGIAMRGFEAAQRQRHADVVVQVAARDETRAGAAEDRARHLLDRRLAVAARDADDRASEIAAPGAREGRERRQRVAHDHLRQRHRDRSCDQRARRAALERLGHELVRIEAIAAQRHEQRARLERP